jgi:hypothetical protein
MIRRRLASWASDTRTDAAVLRRALDDLIACEELFPPGAYMIKSEYPALERMLEEPENPGRAEPFSRLSAFFRSWPIRPSPEQIHRLSDAWRSWRRESERSRRALRLAIANWLAYYERPQGSRPKPARGVPGPFAFYEFGPESPATARAVSPAELGHWLDSTIDANALLRSWGPLLNFRRVQLQVQANHRALLVLVAGELYRRERGTDPPSDEALVGPYLTSLPDDGAADAGNPSAP